MEEEVSLRFYPKIDSAGLKRDYSLSILPTTIQEKLDGSQMSCSWHNGVLKFFNRGREIVEPIDFIFEKPISVLRKHLTQPDEFVYHGEIISKLPRHNKIHYGRYPRHYFVLFDIQTEDGKWLEYPQVKEHAERLGLEVVQCFYHDWPKEPVEEITKNILSRIESGELKSMLGGDDRPEGVVVKNPSFLKENGKVSASKVKVVRKEFKEAHKLKSPFVAKDEDANLIVDRILDCFPRQPRIDKAVQKLRDRGIVDASEKSVIRFATNDLKEECEGIILEYLKQEMLPYVLKKWGEGDEK